MQDRYNLPASSSSSAEQIPFFLNVYKREILQIRLQLTIPLHFERTMVHCTLCLSWWIQE